MTTITQTMRYRQAIINHANKYGVTKAAIRYKTNRQYIYRWMKRYDGTLQSLDDKSHRSHHHPNQHTEEEIKLIIDKFYSFDDFEKQLAVHNREYNKLRMCPLNWKSPADYIKAFIVNGEVF